MTDYKQFLLDSARWQDIEGVETSLRNGADVNSKYSNGSTALIYASWYCNTKLVNILVENNADVNAININGETSLIRACKSCCDTIETIQILLANGANIYVKDIYGGTALEYAKARHSPKYARLIETHIEKINNEKIDILDKKLYGNSIYTIQGNIGNVIKSFL